MQMLPGRSVCDPQMWSQMRGIGRSGFESRIKSEAVGLSGTAVFNDQEIARFRRWRMLSFRSVHELHVGMR